MPLFLDAGLSATLVLPLLQAEPSSISLVDEKGDSGAAGKSAASRLTQRHSDGRRTPGCERGKGRSGNRIPWRVNANRPGSKVQQRKCTNNIKCLTKTLNRSVVQFRLHGELSVSGELRAQMQKRRLEQLLFIYEVFFFFSLSTLIC